MKRIGTAIVLAVAVLIAVLVTVSLLYPWRSQVETTIIPSIAIDEDQVSQHLAEAIRFQTVFYDDPADNDWSQFQGLHQWLEQTYPSVSRDLSRETVNEHSLLYVWEGVDPALDPVLFLAHLDVVPVQQESERDWTESPFAGVVSNGYVWGRGALDMKAILVGIMEAVEQHLTEGHQPRRSIIIVFGHDEEVGGQNGAVKVTELLRSRGVQFEWVIDEGSAIVEGVVPGLDVPVALLGVAEKGYLTLEIVAQGGGGHSSMPPAETAVTRLAEAISTLQRNRFVGGIDGIASEMFATLGPHLPLTTRVALANRWLFGRFLDNRLSESPTMNAILRTTSVATMLAGSPKDNVLPTSATATVNVRIHPRDTVETVLTNINELFEDDPTVSVRFDPSSGFSTDPSSISSRDSEGYKLIERTVRQVFPRAIVSPYLVIAATDSRHFAGLAEDTYRFGPMAFAPEDLERPHGTDERIGTSAFANVVRFYYELIRNLETADLQ